MYASRFTIKTKETKKKKKNLKLIRIRKPSLYVYEAACKGLKESKLKKLSSKVKNMLKEDLKKHKKISDHK